MDTTADHSCGPAHLSLHSRGENMDTVTEWVRVSGGANLATDLPCRPWSLPVVIVRTVYGRKNLRALASCRSGHATVVGRAWSGDQGSLALARSRPIP